MIQTLMYGRTGHVSTRLLFGAAALGGVTQKEADQTMELLMEAGINHIDTAASYGNSEERLGPWTGKYRDRFFLATKTEMRTYAEARESIHRSLELLRTDHLDAIQLHAVIEDSEFETAMGSAGALEAAVEARAQGLVRFIGITSHTLHAPVIHRMALEKFDFDSVLLPCNYMLLQNPTYAGNFTTLLGICQAKNVAVQIIKTAQRRPYAEGERTHDTWYKPFETQASIDLAIHWALARPGVFINTAGDIHILPMILDAAKRFQAGPSDAQMDAMLREQEAAPLWA